MNSFGRLDKDYSAKSMGILSQKVRNVFARKFPEANVWIPDTYELPRVPEKTTDVVFFGDFFRKFLETGNWTPESYRIWCLGNPTKNFLTKLGHFNDSQVSVIPRDLLFKTPDSSGVPDLKTDAIEFVYAGRLTASKRILTMIWSVFHLQEMGINATLSLYGEFFHEEKFCDCPGTNPYKDQVLTLIKTLSWKHSPKLHGQTGPSQWLTHEAARKPVYYSLSVLPFEDFAVSVAEAQEQGWPCVLSNWGAHKDIPGTVMRVPLQVFENITESMNAAVNEGKMIAAYIGSRSFTNLPAGENIFRVPETVTLTDFDKRRREFLNTWGMNFQDVIRHRTEDLKDSPRWEQFLREYAGCFM